MMDHTQPGTLSSMTAHAARARPASPTAALFGAVMALVALTVGFATLGVYLGRNSGGAAWFVAWLLSLGCLIGLNVATRRGQNGLALGLLLAFGALTGWSVATTINYYAETDPLALRQAFGATALTVAALGAGGYAVRRDLSFLYRILFWLLLALLAAGVVLIFIRIPALYTVWSLLGLALFCVYTVVDFNRLRRAGKDEAIPLAASIFIDVLNIFLFFLQLFGRRSS
jgi:FtsH-binding integral membrane protein